MKKSQYGYIIAVILIVAVLYYFKPLTSIFGIIDDAQSKYSFENNLKDTGILKQDCTILSGNPTFVQGNVKYALQFNNNSKDALTCGSNPALNIKANEDFSVAIWVTNRNSQLSSRIVGRKPSLNSAGWEFYTFLANGVYFRIFDGTSTVAGIGTTTSYNTPTHFVAVVDKANKKLKYYKNGVKTTNDIDLTARGIQLVDFPDSELTMGNPSNTQSSQAYFNGTLDEVMIFKKALTDQEVLDLYNFQGDILQCPLYNECLGDLNGDKIVNDADTNLLSSQWLKSCNEANQYCNGADLSCDGVVNYLDQDILSQNWLKDCNPKPVPCPLYPECIGDLTNDKIVNDDDIDALTVFFLQDCSATNNHCNGADFTCDGRVDFQDQKVIWNNWLKDCNPSSSSGGGGGGGGGGGSHVTTPVNNTQVLTPTPEAKDLSKYLPILLLIVIGYVIFRKK